MKGLTVEPGRAGSLSLSEVAEPEEDTAQVLVAAEALGVCGTDVEIIRGDYGSAPPGSPRLIIGHESLGRVLSAPADSGLVRGDLIVGVVRRPDPVPCECCAVDEWDMCRNGRYSERGIRGLHGYGASRFTVEPAYVVKIDPALGLRGVLLEPTSIVAKAWEQTERIMRRATWQPRRVLVTGAGPIGLLAALLGRQRRYEVVVLDRVKSGLKPRLVRALGATYHAGPVDSVASSYDLVFECTGAPSVLLEAMEAVSPLGVVCLTGVSDVGRATKVDVGALNRDMVLDNVAVFGSVNANMRHYRAAAAALAKADARWLDALVTRRVPLHRFHEAFERREDDVKTVLTFDT